MKRTNVYQVSQWLLIVWLSGCAATGAIQQRLLQPFVINIKQVPSLTFQQLPATGSLWATMTEESLYVYHNPEGTLLRTDRFRAISRLDLLTGKAEMWSLPDRWDAGDIEIINGDIILTHSSAQRPEEAGIYRFEPTTGQLTMLVNIPGVQRVLSPTP